jgi:hypothetical protein
VPRQSIAKKRRESGYVGQSRHTQSLPSRPVA